MFLRTWPGTGTKREKIGVGAISKSTLIIAALAATVTVMGGYIVVSKNMQSSAAAPASSAVVQPMEQGQGEYVKPETPIDRSKNVTLPGWGGFTIPANTNIITQGFEFHNPAENIWYEDSISINGAKLETLVVDSGVQTEINHYLRLANIRSDAADVTDYDADCFAVDKTDEGALTLEAIGYFSGEKTIAVQTEDGQTVELSVTCQENCYYISFGLYLEDGDELLYQSGLVEPGMYVQQMEMTRSLAPGTYNAYVVCQPYRSDRKTETNRGIVKITLTAG